MRDTEDSVRPAARGSYDAYVEHVRGCPHCLPRRCAAGQELCRIYLDEIRNSSARSPAGGRGDGAGPKPLSAVPPPAGSRPATSGRSD